MNNRQRSSGLLSAFSPLTWILTIGGLFLLIPADYFELHWLEIVAFILIALGLVFSKNDFSRIHDHGIFVYYLLLLLFLAAVAFKWFL